MKTLGIVGGIAAESTIVYYRALLSAYKRRVTDGSQPPIIINSIDMMKMLGFIGESKLEEVTLYLSGELKRLVDAGAQFALFASNTPHIVFDALQRRSPIPLLSIVECAAAHAKVIGSKRSALLGTKFTMRAGFYPNVFAREGIHSVLPSDGEQEFIHEKYMGELVAGVFKPETRGAILTIIDRLAADEKIDAVILGGTELPLLLNAAHHNGTVLLDTGFFHAEAAIEEMLRT